MKLAVIGANGRTGQAFVGRAVAAGHSVRAGVRDISKLSERPGLEAVRCDATDLGDMQTLLQGQDAVVSLLGHGRGSPADLQTAAIKNAIKAMRETGMRRIVSLTGSGARMPGDQITLIDRLLNLGINLVDKPRVRDGVRHLELLQASSLDWTVIRVLKLQNTKPGRYTLRLHGPAKTIVSRAEVSQALLEVLEAQSFIGQTPILGQAV